MRHAGVSTQGVGLPQTQQFFSGKSNPSPAAHSWPVTMLPSAQCPSAEYDAQLALKRFDQPAVSPHPPTTASPLASASPPTAAAPPPLAAAASPYAVASPYAAVSPYAAGCAALYEDASSTAPCAELPVASAELPLPQTQQCSPGEPNPSPAAHSCPTRKPQTPSAPQPQWPSRCRAEQSALYGLRQPGVSAHVMLGLAAAERISHIVRSTRSSWGGRAKTRRQHLVCVPLRNLGD